MDVIECPHCGEKIELSGRDEEEESISEAKPEEFSIIPIKEIECSFEDKDKLGGGKYGVVYKV